VTPRSMRRSFGRPVLALCVALAPHAFATELADVQAVAALLDVARAQNPEIRAAEARYRAMRQRPIQERTLPDPTVGALYHNEEFDRLTLGESEFSFFEFSAEQEVPFPGKLGLRGDIAGREAERERAMRDETTLMVLANVAASYADLAAVDRSIEVLDESLATLGLVVDQAGASYEVGNVTQADVLRAQLEQGALRERLTMLAQKRAAAEATINALLARPADERIEHGALPAAAPPLDSLDTWADRVDDQSPTVRAAREEVLSRHLALELARREYYPDFSLMGAYTNKSRLLPEWELGIRIRVPLYFWRRQRAGVAEAAHAEAAAEHTRRNVHFTLRGRLRELYAMADAGRRLVALYRDTLVPQASLTFESTRASYVVGRVDFLTMLSAFNALLEYRVRHAETMGNLYRTRAEIGPLLGETPLEWWGGSR
jgi:outer membrane protein, heavy metal efflux system